MLKKQRRIFLFFSLINEALFGNVIYIILDMIVLFVCMMIYLPTFVTIYVPLKYAITISTEEVDSSLSQQVFPHTTVNFR